LIGSTAFNRVRFIVGGPSKTEVGYFYRFPAVATTLTVLFGSELSESLTRIVASADYGLLVVHWSTVPVVGHKWSAIVPYLRFVIVHPLHIEAHIFL